CESDRTAQGVRPGATDRAVTVSPVAAERNWLGAQVAAVDGKASAAVDGGAAGTVAQRSIIPGIQHASEDVNRPVKVDIGPLGRTRAGSSHMEAMVVGKVVDLSLDVDAVTRREVNRAFGITEVNVTRDDAADAVGAQPVPAQEQKPPELFDVPALECDRADRLDESVHVE